MARKSNKTSHVLHLLAGEEPVPETSEEQASETPKEAEGLRETDDADKNNGKNETPKPSGQQDGASAADMPNISIISTGNSEGDPLADLIKEQLEETFPEEILPPAADAPAPMNDSTADPPEPAASPQLEGQPQKDDAPLNPQTAEPVSFVSDNPPTEDSKEEEPSVQTPAENPAQPPKQEESTETLSSAEFSDTPAPEDAPPTESLPKAASESAFADTELPRPHLDSILYPGEDEESPNYRFVNVMEYIIKDIIVDYMKKFDMCTCERCVVDAAALALTYCRAKYIVVDKHSVSPLLNFYSNRYLGDVTVELTKACIQVKENPRH